MYRCDRLQHQERMQRKADIVRWERVEQEQLREAAKVKEEYSDRILRSKDELTHVISRAKCRLLKVPLMKLRIIVLFITVFVFIVLLLVCVLLLLLPLS